MKEVKDTELHIRLTGADKRLFSEMAERKGVSLSKYILNAAYNEVMRQMGTGNDQLNNDLKGGD